MATFRLLRFNKMPTATTAHISQGIYRHYKGEQYQVIDIVRHSETHEWLVLYKALYGDYGLWVRPLTMFTEQVKTERGFVPRFELILALEEA